MDEISRMKAFGEAIVAALDPDRYKVDYSLRRSLVDVMMDRPVKPCEVPTKPWRDEDEHRFRERFGWTIVEASQAHGVEIPSEVAFRMLVWFMTGPETAR